MEIFSELPFDIILKILKLDGRILYRNGEFVNIIHKNDLRYTLLDPVIYKKIESIKYNFNFNYVFFENNSKMALFYDLDRSSISLFNFKRKGKYGNLFEETTVYY